MSNMTLPNGLPQGSDAAREFLSTLTTNAQGHLVLFSANSDNRRVDSFSVGNIDAAASQAIALSSTHNVYFGLGLLSDAPKSGSRGKAEDVGCIPALWVEIDIAGPGHKTEALPPDLESAKTLLATLPLPPSVIVHSGGGIHCHWFFTEPQMLQSKEERDEVHKLNLRLQATIRQEAEKNGWKIDPTADLARVLRVPGTANHKSSPPRPVHILGWNPERKYTVQDFDHNTIELKSQIKPKRVARQRAQSDEGHFKPDSDFPPANAQTILEECAWFAALKGNANRLTEPEWFEQLVMLSRCENGDQLAQEYSKGYDGYDEAETADKFCHASIYTPMTCQSIQAIFGGEHCDSCIFADHIKAPIQLGDTRPAHKAMLAFWKALPAIQEEPSMVYEDETLEILSAIEKGKPATYAKIINIFKEMGIAITAYKQAMMNYLQKKIILSGGPYHIENNTLIWDKWTASGFSNTALANFAAKIVLEITKDDGLNLEKFFRIESSLTTGEPLPEIEVPATEFGSLNWIIAQYGA